MAEPPRRFSSEARPSSHSRSPVASLRRSPSRSPSPHRPGDDHHNQHNPPPQETSQESLAPRHHHQLGPEPTAAAAAAAATAAAAAAAAAETKTIPPFYPVFALVDDATTRPTTHHPRVHYIFSDDDPEALTAALEDAAAEHPPPHAPSASATLRTPRDRAIVVDLVPDPDGRPGSLAVASAVSLSHEWAVTSAHVTRIHTGGGDARAAKGRTRDAGVVDDAAAAAAAAADDDEDEDDAAEGSGGLMLRIQGVGVDKTAAAAAATALAQHQNPLASSGSSSDGSRHSNRGGRAAGPTGADEFATLADDFGRRMGTLRHVVEASIPAAAAAADDGNQRPHPADQEVWEAAASSVTPDAPAPPAMPSPSDEHKSG